ncbi:MAG: hypothetical protein JXJ17_12455 [Anaerolineae bacterium]|nr:hypothetical protein [Anaerolineae bacterium]
MHLTPRHGLLLFIELVVVNLALYLATLARLWLPLGHAAPDWVIIIPWPLYVLASLIWGISFLFVRVFDPLKLEKLILNLVMIAISGIFNWFVFLAILFLGYRIMSRLQTVYFLFLYLCLAGLVQIVLHRLTHRTRGLNPGDSPSP